MISSFIKKFKAFFDGSAPDNATGFVKNADTLFNDNEHRLFLLAFTSARFKEYNGDVILTKNALSEFGLSEDQKESLIDDLRKWEQQEIKHIELLKIKHQIESLMVEGKKEEAYNLAIATFLENRENFDFLVNVSNLLIELKRNDEAFNLVFSTYQENKNSVNLLELAIQVLDSYKNTDEVVSFIEMLQKVMPSQALNIAYRQGLYLKSKRRYKEAKTIFGNLNIQRQFGWDYYQIAIIENLEGNEKECLDLLEKTFTLDSNLGEDAKHHIELSNIWGNKRFILLTT